jgi:biotin-(acetyl-CoA carboxylase) ligase
MGGTDPGGLKKRGERCTLGLHMEGNQVTLLTDNPDYARRFAAFVKGMEPAAPVRGTGEGLLSLMQEVFGTKPLHRGEVEAPGWRWGCIVECATQSHFDLLIRLAREGRTLPAPLFCIAGSSGSCHGQRDRSWQALDGNLHLALLLRPEREVRDFGPGFLALAAVSVIETLDGLDSLTQKAGIKWVNDILIDGAKVAGFLVHTLSTGNRVQAAVLGLGLNIEAGPDIPSDPVVPRAASLRDFDSGASPVTRRDILLSLLTHLWGNYGRLLRGDAAGLVDVYRRRSVIVGKKAKVTTDPLLPGEREEIIASGTVGEIGPNLELYFRGRKKPVTRGRLVLLE